MKNWGGREKCVEVEATILIDVLENKRKTNGTIAKSFRFFILLLYT